MFLFGSKWIFHVWFLWISPSSSWWSCSRCPTLCSIVVPLDQPEQFLVELFQMSHSVFYCSSSWSARAVLSWSCSRCPTLYSIVVPLDQPEQLLVELFQMSHSVLYCSSSGSARAIPGGTVPDVSLPREDGVHDAEETIQRDAFQHRWVLRSVHEACAMQLTKVKDARIQAK